MRRGDRGPERKGDNPSWANGDKEAWAEQGEGEGVGKIMNKFL